MSLKLVVEMESTNQLPCPQLDNTTTTSPATAVEIVSRQLTEASDAIDGCTNNIHEASCVTGELDDVYGELETSLDKNGGISEDTAKMAEIAVEAICAKVGISVRQERMIPVFESFASNHSRELATKLTMENLKEQAGRVWKIVKAALLKVWEMVGNLFKSLTKNRKALKDYLLQLQESAKKVGDTPKSEKINVGAKAFSIGGNADVSTVKKVLENSIKLVDISKDSSKLLTTFVRDLIDGKNDSEVSRVVEKLKQLDNSVGVSGKNNSATYYGNFTHGRAISLDTESKFGMGEVFVKVDKIPGFKTGSEMKAPTLADIRDILDMAIKNVDTLVAFDSLAKDLAAVNKAALSFADKMMRMNVNQDRQNDDGTTQAKMKLADSTRLRVKMNITNAFIAVLGSRIPSLIFSASKEAATFCQAGLQNLAQQET